MVREFVIDRARRGVVQRVLKNRAGNSRVLVVERNEWVPRDEGDIERNGGVGKAQFGEREFSSEIAFLETREPFGPSAAQTLSLQSLVEDLEWRKGAFDKLGDR